MSIPPRILEMMREAHAYAVDEVGKAQTNIERAAHAAGVLAMNDKIAQGVDNLNLTPEERELFDKVYGPNDMMRAKFNEMRAEAEEILKAAQEFLAGVESDLKAIDPEFGVDKGPELPFAETEK